MAGGKMSDPSGLSGDPGMGMDFGRGTPNAPRLRPPPGLYGADGQRDPNYVADPRSFAGGGHIAHARAMGLLNDTPGVHQVNPANVSTQFGESDPMGTMTTTTTPKMDPRLLQLMMSMRGIGGQGQGQSMQMPQGMPAPQIQPGALMGAMPQMPQGGYRPRGMSGRF